jgi:REP element-mobilizing transposase RayT
MNSPKIYYKRNLPHFQPPGYAIFIIFRLHGTLPADVVGRLKAMKEERLKLIAGYDNSKVKNEKYSEFKKEYFKLYDNYLDRASIGSNWLKDTRIAEVVKSSIHFRDGKEYDLIAYTIMPNHVHLVILPNVERFAESLNPESKETLYIVTKVLQELKKYTARECNKLLNRKGSFWQHESYDHVVRNTKALRRIVDYTLNNPVKAGLVNVWEEWKYSYVNERFLV